ncbi:MULTISPECIES: arginase family protein [Priestia]|uniref:arginase family protein n=1 Tax=Priestia TaxID=2800373 RepID=UPI0006F2C0C2|nr:arginase family protein [Priestia megaterium]KQU25045.1 arginase [Bacillus sp. Leaf75]QLK07292.1 Arginase [Priestia megaterium]USL38045.1 arginase family protein [Priestia megaterium]
MTNKEESTNKTLRLLMPQWQGGNNPIYFLGAQLLNWLAPDTNAIQEEVPISLMEEGQEVEKGIFARRALLKQLHDASAIIKKHSPDRIIVFGGDCGVELSPIAYLNDKYDGDVAILWVDAHPDVNSPEHFENQHAHVLGNLLGIGDEEFVSAVPKLVNPDNILYVGLNDRQPSEKKVMEQFNLRVVPPEELIEDSLAVLKWLEEVKTSKVFIHFDLDVLDFTEFRSILFANPVAYEKMKAELPKGSSMETIIRVLQDVAKAYDVVGLGITEHFPWDAYALQNMLQRLPLIGDINKEDKPSVNWIF